MVSQVTIFHRGGAILWSSTEDSKNPTLIKPINSLIQNVLLSDRTGADSMSQEEFTLKWTFANNLNLVFVAVFYSFQKLLYVDELLKAVKHEFIKMFNDSLKGGIAHLTIESYDFSAQYRKILHFYEKNASKNKSAKSWHDTQRGKDFQLRSQITSGKSDIQKEAKKQSKGGNDGSDGASSSDPAKGSLASALDEIDDEFAKLRRIKSSGPRGFVPKNKKGGKNKKNKKNKNGKGKGKGKKQRDWSALGGTSKKKLSARDIADINLSTADIWDIGNKNDENVDEEEQRRLAENRQVDLESSDEEESDYVPDFDVDEDDGKESESRSIWSRFTSLISDKALTTEDLTPVLKDLETLLSSKNVANSIAVELCNSVKTSLIGKQIGTFGSIRATVKESMTEALERILTPTRPVNILHGISNAREKNRPYTITFIGVNGVGKSTTLSKVIHYLKTRGLQVSVAACDTFRSGAVEQLKTHCKALDVRLFDQGYAKDAASVAGAAIRDATNKYHDDVVLIDTAGRMQNNEPLMRALVNLISKNTPDLVLFVGEALVGNDGVDQLMEFNKALKHFSRNKNPRLIDGIILTKFDAVDDKVGAAISMTYKSGKPIVFLGTGQTYGDLKRAHVKTLINKLLQ